MPKHIKDAIAVAIAQERDDEIFEGKQKNADGVEACSITKIDESLEDDYHRVWRVCRHNLLVVGSFTVNSKSRPFSPSDPKIIGPANLGPYVKE